MKFLATALIAVATMAPSTASAKHKKQACHTKKCEMRVLSKKCSQTRVLPCIYYAARRWHVSGAMLARKARCESTLNPYAVGFAVHHGLFQFLPSTFQTTPYKVYSGKDFKRRLFKRLYSARYNSLAAAWMHHVGRGGEWQCQ